MKKALVMAALIMGSMINFACAGNREKNSEKAQSVEVMSACGEVIPMNNEMFRTNVFDYLGQKEWKYLGTKPAIIDFYADWCGPCRRVAPIMKELAKEYDGQIVVYKVDTDKEKELAGAMGIQSLPTVVFIPMAGQPQVIMGAADKATFKRATEEVLLGKKAKKK